MEKRIVWETAGVVRCPNVGEWFRGADGTPKIAEFDFVTQKFEILNMKLIDIEHL